jgi:hypothetical protein
MLAVQVVRTIQSDKKLASVVVLGIVGHGDHATPRKPQALVELILA